MLKTHTNVCKTFLSETENPAAKKTRISCEEGSVLPEFFDSKLRKLIHLLCFSIVWDLLQENTMKTSN